MRDYPNLSEAKAFVESLWSHYRDLSLADFRQDAKNHFDARFWEMYMAVTLHEHGFQLKPAGGKGPEFYFLHNGRKIWVEAVAPGLGEGQDQVPLLHYGEVAEVPTEQIILRFTNALDQKKKKYNRALEEGIIAQLDKKGARCAPHIYYLYQE